MDVGISSGSDQLKMRIRGEMDCKKRRSEEGRGDEDGDEEERKKEMPKTKKRESVLINTGWDPVCYFSLYDIDVLTPSGN